jgi:mannose-1-phosphate guanylyltransferase
MKQADSLQSPQSRRTPQPSEDNLWAVVLAAGEGRRLATVTRFLYGREIPKQFAALNGERTLLQQTMERLAPLVPAARTVVVVAADRRELADSQLAAYPGVQIVSQPQNVGTGPGVLLPVAVVKAQAPDATVIVTPSDHHIPGQRAFLTSMDSLIHATTSVPAGLVLLGAEADNAAVDLGWIVPRPEDSAGQKNAEIVERSVEGVESFVEKPPLSVATQLFRRGGLWNTLVLAGHVDAFWKQFQRRLPRQTGLFAQYVSFVTQHGDGMAAASLLDQLYRSMPAADFSRAILQSTDGLGVVRLRHSGWCDCGTPQRLLSCLDERAANTHPQLLQAILRTIQVEELQRTPSIQGG